MGHPFDVPEPIELPEQDGRTYPFFVQLMRRLLAEDGCPWDRKQTLGSLRRYVLEEACEVMDAIDAGDDELLCEELGDLALQVVFLSELAQRKGAFGHDDVMRGIIEKLVRRHPHVFAQGDAETAEEVALRWDQIKAEEKKKRPLLDSIPRALPALDGARRVSERVATVGFDWPDEAGSLAKVEEERAELEEARLAGDGTAVEHEFGDLLFALVNYGRHLGVDPEVALGKTINRFRTRFDHVEGSVRAVHGDWPRNAKGKVTVGVPLHELERYWQAAKEREK